MKPELLTADYVYRLDDLARIAAPGARLEVAGEVAHAIARAAAFVERVSSEERLLYGINTGYGSLCRTRIAPELLEQLQTNHLLSHACGVGPPIDETSSRMVLLAKLLSFRAGHSGIRPDTVGRLVDFWNAGVTPAIPERGSVGASGDLAPLAHLALPLLGLGQVWSGGRVRDAADVLPAHGWGPIRLGPKEGLALTNGVQFLGGCGARLTLRARRLIRCADLILSLSIQGFATSAGFYSEPLHSTSRHRQRQVVAGNLRRLLAGSNHAGLPQCDPAQEDPYSFRCAPQVHAAIRQTWDFAAEVIEDEVNSTSDNPLVFPELGRVITGGNLHGESVAFALDFLAVAVCELASISERRTYQLLSGQHGLPDFLAPDPGLNSGLMVVQYTAAALVNETKVLATPACIDTIPTCQLQEDHVSMGGTSVTKLARAIENVEIVLAIELLAAIQAIDLAPGLVPSGSSRPLREAFRDVSPAVTVDRLMSVEIEAARQFLANNPAVDDALCLIA